MAAHAAQAERLWTIEEWEATPMPEGRFELVRGHLVKMPDDPTLRHEGAAHNLRDLLNAALPSDSWKVFMRGGPRLVEGSRPTLRLPDVWALARAAFEQHNDFASVPARDVLLVVEILGPSTAKTDRVDKRAEYEAAGIPHYWIFDVRDRPRGPKLTVLRLVDGAYREIEAGPDETGLVDIAEPARLSFRWDDLLR